jgi:probable HAF family extracellular repeat protein
MHPVVENRFTQRFSSAGATGRQQAMADSTQSNSADHGRDRSGDDRHHEHHHRGYTFTTIDPPDGSSALPSAINDRGEVVGYYGVISPTHGFVYEDGSFTTLEPPRANEIFANAINDHGEVAGWYTGSDFHEYGFVYDNGKFTTLNVPSAGTHVDAINNHGVVAGHYYDSNYTPHSFLASRDGPDATAATLSDLLSSQASPVSMSDLLTGALGPISGGSPQSASASGMVDQNPTAGASFAPFGDVESVQAATTMLVNNGRSSAHPAARAGRTLGVMVNRAISAG